MSSSSWFSPSLTGMIWNKAGLHTCPGMFDQVIQRSNTRATQEICSPGVRWSTHQRGNQNPSTEIHYQPRLIIQDHNNGGSMESDLSSSPHRTSADVSRSFCIAPQTPENTHLNKELSTSLLSFSCSSFLEEEYHRIFTRLAILCRYDET
ncbi:hypothetical protein F2Q69_00052637 [Brassica cretica]|uniref:Uncharacterized protein n=1 Tax=Brassica cretica TaxID=69181 RepID=A0A8S9MZF1_BRACR|nr:hypothetical protein F2Q69_00052637 [Brassica cretica]